MLSLLAATNDPYNLDSIAHIFARVDTLAHPERLIPILEKISVVWAVVFLIAGCVCMLNGAKIYKWVTIVIALAFGILAGHAMGRQVNAQYIVAGCLGALLAVIAWPMMKYAVALMGGMVGAFLGANVWVACSEMASPATRATISENYWVGALIGLLVCGMLAFILFKLTIVLFTSISGATLAMLGALVLIMQVPSWRDGLRTWAHSDRNSVVLPLLVFVPALIGLILQQTKGKGGDAPGGGGGGGGKPAAKPA